MDEEIHLVKADPVWIQLFEKEREEIYECLSSYSWSKKVEHIGSTSIPSLDAKPIIDIMVGVKSMGEADKLLECLLAHGYDTDRDYNKTLEDRRFLVKFGGGKRTHHLHLVLLEGITWHRWILFRDKLRRDSALVSIYESKKYRWADKYRFDREAYTRAKDDFVAHVLSVPVLPESVPDQLSKGKANENLR